MELTNDIIEKYGYAKVNNSTWRKGNFTLQNAYTHSGNNIYEKILNTEKAYKVCHKGKFLQMIHTEKELNHVGLYEIVRRRF